MSELLDATHSGKILTLGQQFRLAGVPGITYKGAHVWHCSAERQFNIRPAGVSGGAHRGGQQSFRSVSAVGNNQTGDDPQGDALLVVCGWQADTSSTVPGGGRS